MSLTIELPEEYRALYGVRADEFDIKENSRSKLGTKFWAQDKFSRWYFMPISLSGILLPMPVIRAQTRKTVVETPMVERAGSVKEIISLDDYVFNIRGIIKRPDGAYPEDELKELVALFNINEAVTIECPLTNILLDGRDKVVVVTNFSLPDKPGQTSMIMYDLEMTSDTKFELEIIE